MNKACLMLLLTAAALALPPQSGRAVPLRFPTLPHVEPHAHKSYQERLNAKCHSR